MIIEETIVAEKGERGNFKGKQECYACKSKEEGKLTAGRRKNICLLAVKNSQRSRTYCPAKTNQGWKGKGNTKTTGVAGKSIR